MRKKLRDALRRTWRNIVVYAAATGGVILSPYVGAWTGGADRIEWEQGRGWLWYVIAGVMGALAMVLMDKLRDRMTGADPTAKDGAFGWRIVQAVTIGATIHSWFGGIYG